MVPIAGNKSAPRPAQRLGKIGLWSMALRFGPVGSRADTAAELDELGYGALWIPGAMDAGLLEDTTLLLDATRSAAVATGILNIWMHEPQAVGAWWRQLSRDHQARLMLGLGVSHSATIGEAYRKPLAAMRDYLTRLATEGIPATSLCLAALGPKMLELARDRTAGAHPYLVTPEHTAIARAALGPGPLLAPEQGVVLDTDPARARDIARPYVRGYGRLENYANSWRRLGFSEDDIAGSSDRLVDALFACGSAETIALRVNAHIDAGADHVCLQVVVGGAQQTVETLLPVWRELAAALL